VKLEAPHAQVDSNQGAGVKSPAYVPPATPDENEVSRFDVRQHPQVLNQYRYY
jgi:hypothetical protein